MKKLLLLLLLTTTFNFFGQTISPLSNGCFGNPFDLTTKNTELLNGQSSNDFTITFYLTLSDATNLTNPIANPNIFVGTNNQNIFANVLNNLTTISVVKSFVLVVSLQAFTLEVVVIQPTCNNNGIIQVNASGGSGFYNFTYFINGLSVFVASNNGLITGLPSGLYQVRVTDSNGCTAVSDVIVLENPNPIVATTQVSGNTVTILASGGNAPYTYSIDNGASFGSTPTFLISHIGLHFYTVKDSNGCTIDGFVNISNCGFNINIVSSLDIPTSTFIVSILNPIATSSSYIYFVDGSTSIPIPIGQNTFNLDANLLLPGNHTIGITDLSTQCTVYATFNGGNLNPNSIDATYIATYQDFNNDGFTNVGDVVNYNFTVINNASEVFTNITMSNNGSALNIYGGPITTLNAGSQDTTTFTGVHAITQNDINQGFVRLDALLVGGTLNSVYRAKDIFGNTTLNISNGIKLNAFIDTNSNGIQDGTEQNFILGSFTTQLNAGMVHNVTSSNGVHYLYETNPANSYNFTYAVNSAYASQYSVAIASYNNISVASGSGITTLNFAITVIPYNDLSINMFGNAPNPGFTYYNYISYSNNGNTTIPTGTVTFNLNNVVSIINISEAGAVNNATGFTYDFSNLLPYETRSILVTMQVPVIPTVSLGQQLTNSANITIPPSDVNVANNNFNLTQTIVGSFDPNDKTESHGGKILRSGFTANDYLTYKIQFENTGTANAITVKVTDVLDNLLDENSINMVASSHNYTLDRTGKNLEWKFNAINLPPSVANTQIGHGYLVFQIKPKPGFAVGDIIPNFASIYFDFNPAIVTETCNTEFVAALSNESFAFNNLRVYPIPATSILNIDNKEIIDYLEVSNVLGQTILNQKVDNLESKIDLSGLTNGVYFVKIAVGENEKVLKVIKE